MSADYASIRDGLLETVDRLSHESLRGGLQRLVELKEKILNQEFNMVIMGQFKRGKSTFINALLGAEIVPTAIVPLTSIVTILRFGEKAKGVVHYVDNRKEEISLSDIGGFVTEKGNPQNKRSVKYVEAFYPSDYLKEGVRIIDTPGVGSVFRHNTDVAYAYLPYVDAGVFVVTADPPLGQSEHEFLKDVRAYVDKLFFVLNKIDTVDEKDLGEAVAFTGDILTQNLRRPVELWPLSAKLAFDGKLNKDTEKLDRSRLSAFEKHLRDFLHHEKGKVFLDGIISPLLRHVADESVAYKLEQEAAKLSLDELNTKIAKFDSYAQATRKGRAEKAYILEGQIKNLHKMLDDDLYVLKKAKIPILIADVENVFQEKVVRSVSSRELEKEMEGFVFAEILGTFSTFRNKESEKIAGVLESIYIDLANRTNETIESIVRLASDIFEVELKPFTTVEKLTSKSDFYFFLRDDPDATALIQLGIRFALPTFVTKGVILKRIRAMAREIFERHCGRVRYDLIRRTEETTRSFRKSLNDKIDFALVAIRDALNRAAALKDQNEVEVSQTVSDLSARLSAVEEIRVKLLDYRRMVGML
ncbi:MAG: dynamin family protein [Desulfobacterales bacterium]|nr:dynamin family protein [Desulfobacterales bacterium]